MSDVGGRLAGAGRFGRGAALLIGVAVLVRGLVMAGGWFHADDFAGIARSADPFLTAVGYGEGGHVAWVQNAWNWAFAQVFAYQWPAYVLQAMVGFALVSVLLLVLLVRLWGRRPGVLWLLAAWLFAPLLTPSLTWHSASLLFLFLVGPALLTALVADAAAVGSRAWLLALPVAYGFALVCSERAVGLVPALFLLLALARWPHLARRGRVALLAAAAVLGAVSALFLGWYLGRDDLLFGKGSLPLGDRLELWRDGAAVALNAIVGGPWTLDATGVTGRSAPALLPVLLGAVLLLAVAAVCVLRAGRRAVLAWLVLAAYLLADVTLVTAGRGTGLGVAAVGDVRYFSEVQLLVVLVLGIGLLGPAVGAYWPVVRRELWDGRATIAVLGAGIVVLSGYATLQLAGRWWANPARPYFQNAFSDLAQRPGLAMVDSQLPADVITPLLTTDTLAARVLVGFDGAPVFGRPAVLLGMLGADGHVHPAVVTGDAATPPGPVPGCGYPVGATGRTLALESPLYPWNWVVQVDYLAGADGTATVRVGDQAFPVELKRGPGTVYLPYSGPVSTVRVDGLSPGLGVCVDRVRVGVPAPDPTRGVDALPAAGDG